MALALSVSILACKSPKTEEDTSTKKETMVSSKDLSTDFHSHANPGEAVITHLDWEAKVDFDKKIISGIARLSIKKTDKAIKLVLDTKGLNIEKVTLGDQEEPAGFTLGEAHEILGSELTIPINEKTKKVNIYYQTSPKAEALQWLDPVQTAGKKHPFLFTQSQAILARSWIPLQDSPGIRFTYTAKVEVPKGLMALMSAENPQKVNEDGIYRFVMPQPIPAYLMALSVGDLTFESLGDRSGVYAEKPVIKKAVYEFGEMENMLAAAEELYGPYQWGRYDLIVLPPSFPFGGMENPRLTFATPTILAGDRSLTSLVAHELAHSWSGNLVTNANWNDFWLNEGFTVYFENRIMEALYGPSYSEMLAQLSQGDLKNEVNDLMNGPHPEDTKLKLNLTGRNPDDGMTAIAYDKGFFFLKTLENKVGREKWDNFLKEYFTENAFKTMTTESFISYMNENLFEKNGIPVDDKLYQNWIYGEGLPKDFPTVKSERFENVDKQLKKWISGSKASSLQTKDWSTHEWLYFIRQLPKDLKIGQMNQLDKAFKFTASGNSEILAAWFIHVIDNHYKAAYPKMEEFLINVGRRKFLVPVYGEMLKEEGGKEMALDIYKKARPNYHFVSSSTLDEMLGYSPN
ncbi:M1 family peptidase [Cytophagales bacterium RKSG123]|nr:M1 family peptidase [Xanthovirga aplysinae]